MYWITRIIHLRSTPWCISSNHHRPRAPGKESDHWNTFMGPVSSKHEPVPHSNAHCSTTFRILLSLCHAPAKWSQSSTKKQKKTMRRPSQQMLHLCAQIHRRCLSRSKRCCIWLDHTPVQFDQFVARSITSSLLVFIKQSQDTHGAHCRPRKFWLCQWVLLPQLFCISKMAETKATIMGCRM